MKRYLLKELIAWKDSPQRVPLIIRGARQVGKSYLVEQFGTSHFKSFASVNFEQDGRFQDCFTTLHPEKIVANHHLDFYKLMVYRFLRKQFLESGKKKEIR